MTPGAHVTRSITIPEDEIEWRFMPSGGPGGQHANKSSTRAEITWNVASSRALGPRQRDRIMGRLRRRIDSAGNLRLSSDAHRSQLRNREDALRRLSSLVAEALTPPKKRVPTKAGTAAHRRRLEGKRRRGNLKKQRRIVPDE